MYKQDENWPGVYWLTSKNGEKSILDLRNCKKIAVGISGGADSTSMLYIVSRIIKDEGLDIEVTPHTFLHHGKPWNPGVAKRAAEMVSSMLDIKYGEHVFKDFGPQGPTAEIKSVFVDKFMSYTHGLTSGPTKEYDRFFGATTSNPNSDHLREHPDCDKSRNVSYYEPQIIDMGNGQCEILVQPHVPLSYNSSPYKWVDKKMTATVYETYDLGETLLPYTEVVNYFIYKLKTFNLTVQLQTLNTT